MDDETVDAHAAVRSRCRRDWGIRLCRRWGPHRRPESPNGRGLRAVAEPLWPVIGIEGGTAPESSPALPSSQQSGGRTWPPVHFPARNIRHPGNLLASKKSGERLPRELRAISESYKFP